MTGLVLGGVYLQGFEIPGGLRFGGRQALAVHKLPGGTRVVDALGPDNADITWSGVLSGAAAADRARALDLMRSAGAAIPLAWDAFYYTVIIRVLDLGYASPWWIPYRMACTVVTDAAQAALQAVLTDAAAITGDLDIAGEFTNVSPALSAVAQAGALTPGTAEYASAGAALGAASIGVAAQIAVAEAALGATDLGGIASAAGSLAMLSSAQAYLSRAVANFANVSD